MNQLYVPQGIGRPGVEARFMAEVMQEMVGADNTFPDIAPAMTAEERASYSRADKIHALRAGALPFIIFFAMMFPFIYGWTSLVESSVIGVAAPGAIAFAVML